MVLSKNKVFVLSVVAVSGRHPQVMSWDAQFFGEWNSIFQNLRKRWRLRELAIRTYLKISSRYFRLIGSYFRNLTIFRLCHLSMYPWYHSQHINSRRCNWVLFFFPTRFWKTASSLLDALLEAWRFRRSIVEKYAGRPNPSLTLIHGSATGHKTERHIHLAHPRLTRV